MGQDHDHQVPEAGGRDTLQAQLATARNRSGPLGAGQISGWLARKDPDRLQGGTAIGNRAKSQRSERRNPSTFLVAIRLASAEAFHVSPQVLSRRPTLAARNKRGFAAAECHQPLCVLPLHQGPQGFFEQGAAFQIPAQLLGSDQQLIVECHG